MRPLRRIQIHTEDPATAGPMTLSTHAMGDGYPLYGVSGRVCHLLSRSRNLQRVNAGG